VVGVGVSGRPEGEGGAFRLSPTTPACCFQCAHSLRCECSAASKCEDKTLAKGAIGGTPQKMRVHPGVRWRQSRGRGRERPAG